MFFESSQPVAQSSTNQALVNDQRSASKDYMLRVLLDLIKLKFEFILANCQSTIKISSIVKGNLFCLDNLDVRI